MKLREMEKALECLNILFVCNANKGRSAVAHAYINQLINDGKLKNIRVDSGGLKPQSFYDDLTKRGEPGAPKEIVDLLKKLGVKTIEKHIAKPVSKQMLTQADLVLTFDTKIRDYLINQVQGLEVNKIQTIKGYVNNTEGLNWKNNETDDAQKFEGVYQKYCPYFKEDGNVDMAKIWGDTRYSSSQKAIYLAFGEMANEASNLANRVVSKVFN